MYLMKYQDVKYLAKRPAEIRVRELLELELELEVEEVQSTNYAPRRIEDR